jgi:hypothetical protein
MFALRVKADLGTDRWPALFGVFDRSAIKAQAARAALTTANLH